MSIYIRRGKHQRGPITHPQAQSYYAKGTILPTDLMWRDESPAWVRADSVLAPKARTASAPSKRRSKSFAGRHLLTRNFISSLLLLLAVFGVAVVILAATSLSGAETTPSALESSKDSDDSPIAWGPAVTH